MYAMNDVPDPRTSNSKHILVSRSLPIPNNPNGISIDFPLPHIGRQED